jgi:hypothetical protein
MKRQRGRGRKPGGGGGNYHNNNQGGHHHPNRQLETNGPDTKFRGTASYIHERYLALARDAQSSGDRVLGENYLQHADHYFRLVRSMQPAMPVQPQQFNDQGGYEGDDEGAPEAGSAEEFEARGGQGDEQREADHGAQTEGAREDRGDRSDGDGGRRRGRNRQRFRDGDRGFEGRAEGGDVRRERVEGGEPRETREPREAREQREPREPRRERQPRDDRDSGSREGFSDGPKPAFLRGGGSSSES